MNISTTLGPAQTPTNRLLHVLWGHPLFFYFLLALGLSWVYELPIFGLLHLPFMPWGLPALLVGPTFAAFLMTWVTEGKAGVLHLLLRCVRWRVGIQWYLFALLGISAMVLFSFLVLPGNFATLRAPTFLSVLTYLATYLVIFMIGGPLLEEPGWRGFALPRLQQRTGPFVGSLLLGMLWSLWHLPLFLFLPGYDGAGSGFVGISIAFVGFAIFIIAWTSIITWVFNNTRGSVLLAMLIHASNNTAISFIHSTQLITLSHYLCFVVVALLIIAATRGRLGYQRYKCETALTASEPDREQEPASAHTSL